ncbi:3-phenylpropionate/trans-cinnamate dioxygenase ferredoxin reductase subunit [Rhodobium orientis]|uniref:Pyridine nucleotide-disulfide oxidoreductase n=1 Tax=Rhodobium orientis TaxID=34017 RepID=A0A327JK79_9HYPH|nr:FAD-dependent oxidoreductase [Rhodobium orientis]MBB4303658.1 3-phenylpropionate/trans-cinnamate dioxygenase ferredoxin reductase subunit [Rhodobium orientis]MBK5951886.1 pyridine nucleotide-disulfide oxidoreductase [Rhodobium orientis]RAI26739.1 pyridine nucleotide-disulfide oxidoreductase [Rhodobium orientis]
MAEPIVIVGAGLAGANAAETLRALGYDGDLVLIGEEAEAPYARTLLSKSFLSGEVTREDIALKGAGFFEDLNIDFRAATRVTALNAAEKTLGFADGSTLSFAKLLLTTGNRARLLDVTGRDLPGIVALRKIGDAEFIRPRIKEGGRVVIVGGGYIGMEVAAVARAFGAEVTVVEAADRVMRRIASPFVSDYFVALHRDNGVDVRLQTRIRRFAGGSNVETVRLESGELIAADLVVIATGTVPNDELATAAGIATDDGIIVDAMGHSTAPDIFAAGDCARFFSARYGREIRVESVQNAVEQSKVTAAGMLGQRVHYDPVPCFTSVQYGMKLEIAGLSQYYDDTCIVGRPEDDCFVVYYMHEGRLFAADSLNDSAAHEQAVEHIGEVWQPAEPV